jgi:hypothetical protein
MLDTARALAQGNLATYVWRGESRIAASEAADLLRASTTPIVLIVDKIGDHVDQIMELMDLLRGTKARVFVLGFDRSNRKKFIESIAAEAFYESSSMQVLTTDEANAFIRELRRTGRLGERAGKSDKTLASIFSGNDLLSALLQVVTNTDLTGRIKAELRQLAPLARKAYALVCIVHQHGLPARLGIIRTAAGCSAKELVLLVNGELRDLVMPHGSDFVVSRHRVVAEHTCRLLGTEVYDYYVSMARALRPYVSREAIKQRLLEARLAGRLFDADG